MNREWDKQMAYGTEARAGVSGPRDQPTWPPTQAEYGALISRITALTEEGNQNKRMAQVCLDLHAALGVPWGEDPYAKITSFTERAEQAESRLRLMEEGWRGILKRARDGLAAGSRNPSDTDFELRYGGALLDHLEEQFAALAQPADAKPEQADETAWLIERPEGRWGTGFYWCGLDGYAHSSGEWGVIEKAVRFSRKADAEKIIAGINVRQRRRRKDSLKMEACEHQWLATHPTPASGGQRDNDWILAIGHALGLDSGFDIPIVPEVEPFRKLFAAIRKQHVNDSGAKADTTARED